MSKTIFTLDTHPNQLEHSNKEGCEIKGEEHYDSLAISIMGRGRSSNHIAPSS